MAASSLGVRHLAPLVVLGCFFLVAEGFVGVPSVEVVVRLLRGQQDRLGEVLTGLLDLAHTEANATPPVEVPGVVQVEADRLVEVGDRLLEPLRLGVFVGPPCVSPSTLR